MPLMTLQIQNTVNVLQCLCWRFATGWWCDLGWKMEIRTTECSREDIGQLGFGKWISNFEPAVRHGGPTWRTLLRVGRAARTLMMRRCNWTSSLEACELRPKQSGWITRSPLGWTNVVFIACWFGRWPNMKKTVKFQVELRKLLGNKETNLIKQGITSLEEALYQATRIGGRQMQPNQM